MAEHNSLWNGPIVSVRPIVKRNAERVPIWVSATFHPFKQYFRDKSAWTAIAEVLYLQITCSNINPASYVEDNGTKRGIEAQRSKTNKRIKEDKGVFEVDGA